MKYDFLIVGLGNPGKKYSNTRHNIGWMVAEALCQKNKSEIKQESKIYFASTIDLKISPKKEAPELSKNILVAFPTTFMNHSGEAVRKISARYRIHPSNILIICDEYNFPVGRVQVKRGGSDGGHNGITSIIEELQSENFIRLRCGIGRDFGAGELVDYVLSEFKPEEINMRNIMIDHAVTAVEYYVMNKESKAMSDINSNRLWLKSE